MKIKNAAILLILFTTTGNAFAWDGNIEGFMLGIGFGFGYDEYTGIQYDSISSKKHNNNSIAFAASPRISYAFNDQMAIMYARHPLTYTVESDTGNDVKITTCTEGVQFMYFFEKRLHLFILAPEQMSDIILTKKLLIKQQ
ncbi:MAG: hypothetical protein PF637_01010 [Spirochaetes bacterium]|jgi:predicted porin|nr:hypothetical protein [Spirochaetota bacterium]